MSVRLSAYPFVCVSVCLSVCLPVCLPVRLSVRLSVCPFVCQLITILDETLDREPNVLLFLSQILGVTNPQGKKIVSSGWRTVLSAYMMGLDPWVGLFVVRHSGLSQCMWQDKFGHADSDFAGLQS